MRVITIRRIYQSPLSDAPPVPSGTIGEIDDVDECAEPLPLLIVDWDEPYGHVLTDYCDVEAI